MPYAGVATRAVALGVDAALAQLIVLAAGALLALAASLVGNASMDTAEKLLAAFGWAFTVGAYFVLFWTTTGQTPGMRLMGLRVLGPEGEHLSFTRALVRLVGLALAIIPCFAGFVPVLFDDRRRGLQDMLARTVVVYVVPARGRAGLAPCARSRGSTAGSSGTRGGVPGGRRAQVPRRPRRRPRRADRLLRVLLAVPAAAGVRVGARLRARGRPRSCRRTWSTPRWPGSRGRAAGRSAVEPLTGSGPALAIGLVAALWAGLGVTFALGSAFEHIWDMPRVERRDTVRARRTAWRRWRSSARC